ncbi:UNVERIFIED_CONTAM: hypothetical protein Slati_0115500 [Sesamum latifolium]|uniref:Uncharacterized protein n=1 Tax=Sesamum latifolium TaxID=2727402 RepID=A0AAW2Y921_9LAMI
MDKEGSSPARGSQGRWLSDQVAGSAIRSLAPGSRFQIAGYQVAGSRSLVLRSATCDLHVLNSAVSI